MPMCAAYFKSGIRNMIDEIYKIVEKYNEPQISRNFGLRSVGVCEAYPSFDKPFLKVYADERRYASVAEFGNNLHANCMQIARKAAQQEPLCSPCSPCSPWLNSFSAPAHERTPPAPAVHPRLSHAGG